MARPMVRMTSCSAATPSSAQLSKSKVEKSGSMTRAAPMYSSVKARFTEVTWTGW